MISILLAIVLPFVSSVDVDLGARVQASPGLTISFHSDSYYSQRERERLENQRRIQAERNADRRRQESFDREREREDGSFYFWRDTREQHARKHRRLEDRHRQNEQARANREQFIRDEENRDRDERNRQRDEANRQKDERQRQEDDRRQRDQRPARPGR
jgi:hypothetical protein